MRQFPLKGSFDQCSTGDNSVVQEALDIYGKYTYTYICIELLKQVITGRTFPGVHSIVANERRTSSDGERFGMLVAQLNIVELSAGQGVYGAALSRLTA